MEFRTADVILVTLSWLESAPEAYVQGNNVLSYLYVQVFLPADRVPLLHTAEPGGQELAEYICSMAEQLDATPAEAWAALTCLQHATADAKRVCC